nr:serine/threonine protein kinase [Ardenticatenales bacterium]
MMGRYEIRGELGRGGMATVYRAYDPQVGREVALKVLPREFLHDSSFRARFQHEAHLVAALEQFPAIVPIYDFGEDQGQPYIVMRLLSHSLADVLKKGVLTPAEATRILARLAPTLDGAHRLNIIHRDLKPGNILFDQSADPYISDFGIAKLTEASQHLSTSGSIYGTPAYMSPEQAQGEVKLDGRSDIYALGVILFEMLTGKLPYEAATPMGLALKHINESVPRILDVNPTLPRGCHTVITQAMAKKREKRYPTAQALIEALEQETAGKPSRKSRKSKGAAAPSAPLAPTEIVRDTVPPTVILETPPPTPP